MKKILSLFVILFLLCINSIYCENYLYGSKGSTTLLHWPSNSVHYRVHIDGAGDNGLDYQATSNLIQAAYSVWNNVSTKAIWFYYDGSVSGSESAADGVNGHYWVYPPHYLFSGIFYDNPNTPDVVEGASALTVLEDTDYILTDVDILYNGLKEWRGDNYMTWWNEVESVAIHEIGHSFGLAHATSGMSPIPVMTYAADPSSNRRELKFDDRKGVSFLYGGNLIDNETFSGTDTYMWNLTVASGTTLTIQSGSTINFQNGVSLTINGTLNAQGSSASRIIFNSTSGTWGGIRFNSGSSGTIDNCNISYATIGVKAYNSSPNIYRTIIENCGTGVYCDYYASPSLYYNTIKNNNSSPGNGVYCYVYSSPNLLGGGYYSGYNVIRNNSNNGIYAIYNCNPVLGNTYYGQNSVYANNGPEVYAAYYCNVAAEKNWWGSDDPDPSEFSASSSTIDYDPYLLSEPSQNQGRSIVPSNGNDKYLPVFSITSSQADELILAEEKQKEGRYDEAINLFLEVFKKEKENPKGRYALIKIEECFTQAGKKDFLDFSKKELKPLIKEETELYVVLFELETHQLYNMGYKDNAMNNLKTILKKYNYNTEIEKQTLYRIGVFYLDLYNDRMNAQKTFDELAVKYPNDELLTYANLVLNEERYNIQGLKNTDQKIATVIKEELTNYPNPFNPITKISFTLASKDNIKLKVYDILGREVLILANGEFEMGKHEIELNATNLPSGVYFYNLTTSSNSITKKMLLLK